MKRLLLGPVLGGIALLGGLVAWLNWPLPQNQFEWQAAVVEVLRSDSCPEVIGFLDVVALIDPDGVAIYLNDEPLFNRCADFADYHGEGAEEFVAEMEAAIHDTIRGRRVYVIERAEYRRAIRAEEPLTNIFGIERVRAFQSWLDHRGQRQIGQAGWVGWQELVFAFRCEQGVQFGPQAETDITLDRMSAQLSEPATTPHWRARRVACAEFAAATAASLSNTDKYDVGHGTAFVARQDLARHYFASARLWGWEGDDGQ